jgi:hypothetical protein
MKLSRTAARTHADTVHDPGSEMKKSPSVQLKGKRSKATSLNIEPNNIETDDDEVKGHHNVQKPPKDPVGMSDSNKHHPNRPTEPPDEEERGQQLRLLNQ